MPSEFKWSIAIGLFIFGCLALIAWAHPPVSPWIYDCAKRRPLAECKADWAEMHKLCESERSIRPLR